jgi:predicted dehydrogenase
MGATYSDDPRTHRYYRHCSHAEVLAQHPAFAWEAAVDSDPSVLAKTQARWDVAYGATSMSDLVSHYQPEVLVVATPPSAYFTTVAACPGLKAVLCEKPLGSSLEEAREFLDLCDRLGVLVQVNLWRRCDAFYRRLAEGELTALVGRPQVISGVYGNGLLNNGTHLVDFCRMLFGEVAEVRALGPALTASRSSFAGDLDVACSLQFAGGATAILQPLDFGCYREIGLDIWGEQGRLELLNEGLTSRLSRRAPNRALTGADEIEADAPRMLPSTVGEALLQVYDNLADALQGRNGLLSPATSAWRTAVIIDSIQRAVATYDGDVQAIKIPPTQ